MLSRTSLVPQHMILRKRIINAQSFQDSQKEPLLKKRDNGKQLGVSKALHKFPIQTSKLRTTAPLTSRKAFDEEMKVARKELLMKLIGLESTGEQEKGEDVDVQPPVHEPQENAGASRADLTEEEDVSFLQLEQRLLTDATQVDSFNDLVKSEIGRLYLHSPKKDHVCDVCYQPFTAAWELNKHKSVRHLPEQRQEKSKVNGIFPCRICSLPHLSLYALKKHIFKYHAESDVLVRYGKTIENFVGPGRMDEFRYGLFVYLDKDKLDGMIEEQQSTHSPFKIDQLNWDFPISCDIDPANAERRRLLYLKRRELVLKLAKNSSQINDQIERFSRNDPAAISFIQLHFDLIKNTYNEQVPQQALRCLRKSRSNTIEKHEYLPHFVSFTRNQMASQLQLTVQPIMLRTIIGNRAEMAKLAPQIVFQLIKGISFIHESGQVVQNIQPSTVFVNIDASALTFGDILYMVQENAPRVIIAGLHAPYEYSIVNHHSVRSRALQVKDRFSVGIIILETIVGTEPVINATFENLLQKLIQDISQYLDPATLKVLKYLLFNESDVCLTTYITEYVQGEPDVIHECILAVEAGYLEDADLIKWRKNGSDFITKYQDTMYEKYRLYPSDLKSNFDWNTIAEELEHKEQLI